ncbi:MAG TPA: hypothetical protein PLU30_26015 [Verrucomicrobiae bacterium]|nr:hypothetical protein [Verrucomicrobiae bacterium]
MAGLNFKRRFVGTILNGEKRQTIRKPRKTPLRVGDRLHLLTGMRTKSCRKLGVASCTALQDVRIDRDGFTLDGVRADGQGRLTEMARADGFVSWSEMVEFFQQTHGLPFSGVLVRWGKLEPAGDPAPPRSPFPGPGPSMPPMATRAKPTRTPRSTKRTKSLTASRSGKGTKEWSDASYNICIGCEHHCRYCYAWILAGRSNRNAHLRDPAGWAKQALNPNRGRLGAEIGKRGVVMFPTSHDITPAFLPQSLQTIENLIAKGNDVLIVSKPHRDVVAALCDGLQKHKSKVMFRFTIGSLNDATCAFWEPGAPPPAERIEALRRAFEKGFATSVSMEPMLEDLDGTRAVVEAVEPFVTNTIWLGKMGRVVSKWNAGVKGFDEALERIRSLQTDDKILALVDAFRAHPKIAWKDSIKEVIDKAQNGKKVNGKILKPEVVLPPTLTDEQKTMRRTLEATVTRGVKATFEMWLALHRIRTYENGLLYRSRGFETFEAYCLDKWGYAKAHAHRLANCGGFIETLQAFKSANGDSLPLPRSEGQIRPILALPEDRRVEGWAHALEVAPPEQLTGQIVAERVREFSEKKVPGGLSPRARAIRALTALRAAVEGLPKAEEIGRRLDGIEGLI